MGVLDDILEHKHSELAALRRLKLPVAPARRTIELRRSVTHKLSLIAEIKFRSPSAGELSAVLSVGERASAYERCGASMVSVLCDERYFGGSYANLTLAREKTTIPLLCKEFIVDEVQLAAARAYGADAALLIVRCLTPASLRRLLRAALANDLVPIVEICSQAEAQIALDAGAEYIGVNARDLNTLKMDTALARELLSNLPSPVQKLHFSGLSRPEDVSAVLANGADGALIGEALMRQVDPSALLLALAAASRAPLAT